MLSQIRNAVRCNARSWTLRETPITCRAIQRHQSSSTTKAQVPPRKIVSKEERAALRAARRERAVQQASQIEESAAEATMGTSASSTAAASGKKPMDPRLVFGLGLGVPTILLAWGIADEDSPPAKFAQLVGFTSSFHSFADQFAKPYTNKLLPDWESMTWHHPANFPALHTLVLDLENTLVSSTWDRKHGWRHAKRPGVDQFLKELSEYYEIVLYTPSIEGVIAPVIQSLDPNGFITHRLYRDACHYKNGVYMKDLHALGRNPNKIVYLDDDVLSASLNPENHIHVKPFDDPTNMNDDTLARITPFLIEIAVENYDNVPEILRQFEGMDADEIADEFERRVHDVSSTKSFGANKGLASFARMGRVDRPAPEMAPVSARSRQKIQSSMPDLSSKALVGAAPGGGSVPDETASGMSGWMARRAMQKQEDEQAKLEHWNKVMMDKQKEKEERAARQAK